MTTEKNNGGPAYPSDHKMAVMTQNGKLETFGHDGMTLRDWFAGMALQGILAAGGSRIMPQSEMAFQLADEMLKAREQ